MKMRTIAIMVRTIGASCRDGECRPGPARRARRGAGRDVDASSKYFTTQSIRDTAARPPGARFRDAAACAVQTAPLDSAPSAVIDTRKEPLHAEGAGHGPGHHVPEPVQEAVHGPVPEREARDVPALSRAPHPDPL